jgi:hypothetical protein
VSARSIWRGTLTVQKHEIAVKVYSAVEDRQIHFHLLHKRDRTRVQQRMVDPETEQTVPLDEARKAFKAEPGLYVAVTRKDIERSAPEPGREIRVSQFVPVRVIDPQYRETNTPEIPKSPSEELTVPRVLVWRAQFRPGKCACAGLSGNPALGRTPADDQPRWRVPGAPILLPSASQPSSCVTANTWWRYSLKTASSAPRRSDSTTKFAIPRPSAYPSPSRFPARESQRSSVLSTRSRPRSCHTTSSPIRIPKS